MHEVKYSFQVFNHEEQDDLLVSGISKGLREALFKALRDLLLVKKTLALFDIELSMTEVIFRTSFEGASAEVHVGEKTLLNDLTPRLLEDVAREFSDQLGVEVKV